MTHPFGHFSSYSPFWCSPLGDLQGTGFLKHCFWVYGNRNNLSSVTLFVDQVPILLTTLAPYRAWSHLNFSSTPQRHTAFLGKGSEVPVAPAYAFSRLWELPPRCTWDGSQLLRTRPGAALQRWRGAAPPGRVYVCLCAVVAFCFLPAEAPVCFQVICPLMSYWSSAGAAPSHLLGLRSQIFLEGSYWISPRCQSFRKVMLDLISFHFALYAQRITSVQRAQSVRSPGQGANLLCHRTLTWLYLLI